MSNLIKKVNGKPVSEFNCTLTSSDIMKIAAIQLIQRYPELNGLPMDISVSYSINEWRIKLNGICPEDLGTTGNGQNNATH